MGVVFTAPVIILRAWFWARSSTWSVCCWAATRGSQLYVITGRMYFWYVRFKVDRAHPHLLPASRFRTFMRLETLEATLSTWFFQFNLSKVTHRYLNSFNWESASPLYFSLGWIVLWAREKDWKAVFELFIFTLFLSHHSSSVVSALFSICSVFLLV